MRRTARWWGFSETFPRDSELLLPTPGRGGGINHSIDKELFLQPFYSPVPSEVDPRHGPPDLFFTLPKIYGSARHYYISGALPEGAEGLHCPWESATIFEIVTELLRDVSRKLFPAHLRLPMVVGEQFRRNLHIHALQSLNWRGLKLDAKEVRTTVFFRRFRCCRTSRDGRGERPPPLLGATPVSGADGTGFMDRG